MKKKFIVRPSEQAVTVRRSEESGGKNYIDFYAAVFSQRSKLIREWGEVFYEIIAPTAFDGVMADGGLNVIATIDHDRKKMIGRSKSGTLNLTVDAIGLKCSVEVPDTSTGRDLLVMVERGDYFECSFIYTIAENGVNYNRSEEIPVRTITNIARLIDVSIVIDGAFANTKISTRDYDEDEEIDETESENTNTAARDQHDILDKRIRILKLSK